MSHICVVMAVHNRFQNVNMALFSWALQFRDDFSVVVADDGSTDDIAALVEYYERYLNICHARREEGGNVAANLNQGTKCAPPETTHIWYTDGDIIRKSDAMGWAYKHIEEYPNRTIIGRYDWLPPMEIVADNLRWEWEKIIACELPRLDVPEKDQAYREDHRLTNDPEAFEHKLANHSGHILGANFIIPIQAFYDTGGWDEWIPGGNANDSDMGWMLTQAGYGSFSSPHLTGYHMWHPRDSKALAENAGIALVYIFRKRGQEVPDYYKPYIEKEKQWRKEHGWPEV